MKGLSLVVSLGLALGGWQLCSLAVGTMLVPSPMEVGRELLHMVMQAETWLTLSITVARGAAGLLGALVCALVLGIATGSSPKAMRLLAPLVAALQSCPPVLWITLLMVWAGTGSLVPMAVVFATVFPLLFANVAQGCLALDRRLFDMAKLYHVPRWRILCRIILPGITPYLLAGLSYAAATSWKVTAVAEFLGSSTGIGAKLFWAYRMLKMPEIFAWASIVVLLGVVLELMVIAPLRLSAESFTGKIREKA
ncbi:MULTISPECIES: ABC transporter permease subunit [unclassified Pseudodesulfovibrio]|uniref:ABC transporter permease n=1 Tax=unclassified Pseudodesulfovibrio TaxID=2661612 RepID=UPI000FEBDD63|nr:MULTISPECIES: ABC transporter permease subunit [unclassified Pseudodesulfovibrio]MCJ2163404.1 ABC transporter permease subunit [Pseudodesulfovibrio sp. S3-i]RWU06640.1 ABC transporter permease subunit [Pseudodesulfovibrio sp. S3]